MHSKDATDPQQVNHSVVEEHQVHWALRHCIVVLQRSVQVVSQLLALRVVSLIVGAVCSFGLAVTEVRELKVLGHHDGVPLEVHVVLKYFVRDDCL